MMSGSQQRTVDSPFNGSSVDNKTNLIVNYLPQSMSDRQFRVLFAQYGDIRSARIIRNKNTGYSYGFGFVDYFNPEDAANAIENVNGAVFEHKTVKVSYARPSGDEIKNANLYVTNLPLYYNANKVRSLFSPFGEIIQCRLLENGVAFVLFNLHEEACNAIETLNNQKISGTDNIITVKFATKENKRTHFEPKFNRQGNNSMVNENQYIDSQIAGPIRSSSHHNRYNPMVHLPPNNLAPPFNYTMGPVTINQSNYLPPHENEQERVLFVYNIGPDTNESSLNKLFSFYGPVVQVNVIRRNNTGESKGYAFVTMKNRNDAYNAILALNGYKIANNKPLQVSFKKCDQ